MFYSTITPEARQHISTQFPAIIAEQIKKQIKTYSINWNQHEVIYFGVFWNCEDPEEFWKDIHQLYYIRLSEGLPLPHDAELKAIMDKYGLKPYPPTAPVEQPSKDLELISYVFYTVVGIGLIFNHIFYGSWVVLLLGIIALATYTAFVYEYKNAMTKTTHPKYPEFESLARPCEVMKGTEDAKPISAKAIKTNYPAIRIDNSKSA